MRSAKLVYRCTCGPIPELRRRVIKHTDTLSWYCAQLSTGQFFPLVASMNTFPWHRIISTAEKLRTVRQLTDVGVQKTVTCTFSQHITCLTPVRGERRFYNWTFQLQLNLQLMFKLSPNTLGSSVVKNQTDCRSSFPFTVARGPLNR